MMMLYNDENIEYKTSMLGVFSQINLLIDRFHLDNECDIKKQYITLRKPVLSWIQERNSLAAVDDDDE